MHIENAQKKTSEQTYTDIMPLMSSNVEFYRNWKTLMMRTTKVNKTNAHTNSSNLELMIFIRSLAHSLTIIVLLDRLIFCFCSCLARLLARFCNNGLSIFVYDNWKPNISFDTGNRISLGWTLLRCFHTIFMKIIYLTKYNSCSH